METDFLKKTVICSIFVTTKHHLAMQPGFMLGKLNPSNLSL